MAMAIISEVRSFNPKRLSLDLAIVAAEAAPTGIVLAVGGASAPNCFLEGTPITSEGRASNPNFPFFDPV